VLALALGGSPAGADTEPAPAPVSWISQDASGALHWEDGSEVRLWGVSYSVPFSGEYANLVRLHRDLPEVIDRDLDDIRALEGNLVHVLVNDREITDPEGNLLDNPHLQGLDDLVAGCRKRGMAVKLTLITWVPSDGDSTDGFSDHWYRDELIRLRNAWPPQENYVRGLAGHVNPHTGLSYAEDPTVALWDIIQDPQAMGMTKNLIPLDQSTAYAARMMQVLRDAGVRGPVLYSTYGYQFNKPEYGAVFRNSGVSGWSFDLPIGGTADYPLKAVNYLEKQAWQSWLMRTPIEWVWGDGLCPTLTYSFHSSLKNHGFAPLARSLVTSRVQVADLYQYDALPLAGENASFRLSWFNRDFTPAQATAFRIAARLFREIPLGTPVPEDLPQDNWDFDGVRASAWLDVTTLERDGVFLFTHRPPFELSGSLEGYRLLAGADSTDLLGFEGSRWFTSEFDAADGRIDLDLGPRVRMLVDNPFESGKPYLNIRFCKKIAELDETPGWVEPRLADDDVAVYREDGGSWTRVSMTAGRFDAAPGRYRIYLDASR